MARAEGPIILGEEEGEAIWVLGDLYRFKTTESMSGGDALVFEATINPGGGPPPHTHEREDEMFYVLDGELTFVTDDGTTTLGRGGYVHLPRGKMHTFVNQTDSPVSCLITSTPAGIEHFFRAIGSPASNPPGQPPEVTEADIARVMETAPEYGITIHAP